ncbi:MAG: O-antigen ligase family protein [Ginsengibacter sp.]
MSYVIIQSNLTKDELFRVFYKVAVFIGFICLLSLVSAVTGITINGPAPLDDPFSKSAFGGYRTGWSNSIFLYVPILFYFYFFSGEKKVKIPSLLAIIGIVSSQILSGGRAGLIASLFTFLFFTRFKIQNILILTMVIFFVYNSLGAVTIEEYFRASENQIENKEGGSSLDKISSGRVGVYRIGWKLFEKSPLIGNGFSSITYETEGPDIHNTLFKRLVDGGLIFVAPMIFLFVSLYNAVIDKTNRYYNGDNHRVLFRALFFSSIFVSMLEPNYLIGSFQGEAFFWALVCTYLK